VARGGGSDANRVVAPDVDVAVIGVAIGVGTAGDDEATADDAVSVTRDAVGEGSGCARCVLLRGLPLLGNTVLRTSASDDEGVESAIGLMLVAGLAAWGAITVGNEAADVGIEGDSKGEVNGSGDVDPDADADPDRPGDADVIATRPGGVAISGIDDRTGIVALGASGTCDEATMACPTTVLALVAESKAAGTMSSSGIADALLRAVRPSPVTQSSRCDGACVPASGRENFSETGAGWPGIVARATGGGPGIDQRCVRIGEISASWPGASTSNSVGATLACTVARSS
jgi:hypothetical protein